MTYKMPDDVEVVEYKYEGPAYSVHGPEKHQAKGITTNFYIRIDEGQFKDVEFTYTKVQNKGIDDADDTYHLTFDYDVLYSPPRLPKVIQKDFEAVLWEILREILVQTADAISKDVSDDPSEKVFDELDTTVPDEFRPEEFVQRPETD